jgi:hypothetical protein
MIRYTTTAAGVAPGSLRGFFEGWPNPPSLETHLALLHNSDLVVLAIDDQTDDVIGFVTAITDSVLSAYLPLLEVRSDRRGEGIAREMLSRMLAELDGFYMVDAICDEELQPVYFAHGMQPATGVSFRRYEVQSGRTDGRDPA